MPIVHVTVLQSHNYFPYLIVGSKHFQSNILSISFTLAPQVFSEGDGGGRSPSFQDGVLVFSYLDNCLLKAILLSHGPPLDYYLPVALFGVLHHFKPVQMISFIGPVLDMMAYKDISPTE